MKLQIQMKQFLNKNKNHISSFSFRKVSSLLVWSKIEAVLNVNSKKCSASLYSSKIRENTDIFVVRSLSSLTDHRDGKGWLGSSLNYNKRKESSIDHVWSPIFSYLYWTMWFTVVLQVGGILNNKKKTYIFHVTW